MTAGLFTRLAAGHLSQEGKRWPSEFGNGRVFVITSCTGKFSTTSVPLTQKTPLPEDHAAQKQQHEDRARQHLQQILQVSGKAL